MRTNRCTGAKAPRITRRRLGIETLESRAMLNADMHSAFDRNLAIDVFPTTQVAGFASRVLGVQSSNSLPSSGAAASPSQVSYTVPLSAVPALDSLSGATVSLYLDFNGYTEPGSWGNFSPGTTPAFTEDLDPTTFSDNELADIRKIWSLVAEDYAPFNINVTTVEPRSFANGVAERVVIGGDGAWLGSVAGGVSYIDSFTNSIPNSSYVFAANLRGGSISKNVGEATSHEAGHGFGLRHQSLYNQSGKTEYNPGDGARAPIMGVSYQATRGLWWNGTTTSSTTIQDDMAVISRAQNGFGYRVDDHGGTAATATPLAVFNDQVQGSGIIATTADLDFFSFVTVAGTVTMKVDVPAGINNLDARLELRDATGTTLIASAAPTTSFGATITAQLAAGSYRLVVASNGAYGDVGQYTVNGTIVTDPRSIIPTGVTTVAVQDVDGDGRADLVLQYDLNGTRYWQARLSNGTSFVYSGNWTSTTTGGMTVAGVKDVNGDGKADLILQHDDGSTRYWQVRLSTGTSFAYNYDWTTFATTAFTLAGVGDVDGDHKADLVLQYDAGGTRYWQTRLSTGTVFAYRGDWTSTTTTGMKPVTVQDVNGDGRADLVLQYDQYGTRHWQARLSTGSSFVYSGDWTTTTTPDVTVVGVRDVDGDRKADLILQYDVEGIRYWQTRLSTGTSFVYSGNSGNWTSTMTTGVTVAGMGDVDGDGKADLILQFDIDGTRYWQARRSNGSSFGYNGTWTST